MLGREEVLRGLRNFLSKNIPDYHSSNCLKEKEGGKEVVDGSPTGVRNDLCPARPSLRDSCKAERP